MLPRLFVKVSKTDILKSLFFSKYSHVDRFEKEFSEYIGVKHTKAICTGRTALRITLECMGVESGDEVIVPALCCSIVAKTITSLGAVAVLVDVNPEDCNIDLQKVPEKITVKTKAIIAVHQFGMPCDIVGLCKIAAQYNLYVIEDCAQALGATFQERKVGTYGLASCFSLGKGKNITCGEGGLICTNNHELFLKIDAKVESLKIAPATNVLVDLTVLLAYQLLPLAPKFVFKMLDVYFAKRDREKANIPLFRFPKRKALIASHQLSLADQKNKNRIMNSRIIDEKLQLKNQRPTVNAKGVHLYHAVMTEKKDQLRATMRNNDIDAHDYKNHRYFLRDAGYNKNDFPATEKLIDTILFIPNHELFNQNKLNFLDR